MYLDQPEQWVKLAAALRKAGEFALDTETYGQPDKTSPQHRARVHCWSIAILTQTTTTRGYRLAVGRVLPRAALDCVELRDVLEDALVDKWAHNSPHDEHALRNEGVDVKSLKDSLQWLRVACPGVPTGHGLKAAEQWALGLPSRPSFQDMVKFTNTRVVAKRTRHKGCICGKTPCRAKTTSDWLRDDGVWMPHLRVEWSKFSPERREFADVYPVEGFLPSHPRWTEWVEYSLADAVRGMMLVDWLRKKRQAKVVNPWVYA